MSTKSQIAALIDSEMASGAAMPISKQRNVLKDHADSLLNAIYPEVLFDTQATQTYLTLTDDVNATFDIQITKQGRRVFINGKVTVVSTTMDEIGIITAGELSTKDLTFCFSVAYINRLFGPAEAIGILIFDNAGVTKLALRTTALIGETIYFTIFYNTKD